MWVQLTPIISRYAMRPRPNHSDSGVRGYVQQTFHPFETMCLSRFQFFTNINYWQTCIPRVCRISDPSDRTFKSPNYGAETFDLHNFCRNILFFKVQRENLINIENSLTSCRASQFISTLQSLGVRHRWNIYDVNAPHMFHFDSHLFPCRRRRRRRLVAVASYVACRWFNYSAI